MEVALSLIKILGLFVHVSCLLNERNQRLTTKLGKPEASFQLNTKLGKLEASLRLNTELGKLGASLRMPALHVVSRYTYQQRNIHEGPRKADVYYSSKRQVDLPMKSC